MQEKLRCVIYTQVRSDHQAEVEFNSCEAQDSTIHQRMESNK